MLTEETAKALTAAMDRLSDVVEKANLPELAFQLDMFDTRGIDDLSDALDRHTDALDKV